jgi:hypothetical protein
MLTQCRREHELLDDARDADRECASGNDLALMRQKAVPMVLPMGSTSCEAAPISSYRSRISYQVNFCVTLPHMVISSGARPRPMLGNVP